MTGARHWETIVRLRRMQWRALLGDCGIDMRAGLTKQSLQ